LYPTPGALARDGVADVTANAATAATAAVITESNYRVVFQRVDAMEMPFFMYGDGFGDVGLIRESVPAGAGASGAPGATTHHCPPNANCPAG
jgi:hypothetical protein